MKPYDLAGKRVWVAGHDGMVGSALVRRLTSEDCTILTVPRKALDLRNPSAVDHFLEEASPHVILLAAAKVGGILANDSYPADFLFDNLMIEANVINGAFRAGVEKLTFLGSSCIYPKHASQPIPEIGSFNWAARAHQRMVRNCKNRRHQTVRSLPPATWMRFHLRYADKSLWPQ